MSTILLPAVRRLLVPKIVPHHGFLVRKAVLSSFSNTHTPLSIPSKHENVHIFSTRSFSTTNNNNNDSSIPFKHENVHLFSKRSFSTTKNDDKNETNRDKEERELSMWDTPDLRQIFDNNRAWAKNKLETDPQFFKKAAKGQTPDYLLIGCSDSRVGAQEIMGLGQGELFIHRNVANLVVSTDMNFLSVLFYAVNVLKVKEIIVLGHYECGGVRVACDNEDKGMIEHWLRNIRDVKRLHKEELDAIKDPEESHRRLVELNVQEQCFNLYGNSIVQTSQAKTGRPRIHGLVYDIANGLLRHLDIDWKDQISKYRDIYTVADFRRYSPVDIDDVANESSDGALLDTQTDEEARMKKAQKLKRKKARLLLDAVDIQQTLKNDTQREEARLLFDAIDTDKSGTVEREELTQALIKFGLPHVSDEQIEEMMKPLVGKSRESIDLESFQAILDAVTITEERSSSSRDRLVVVKRSDGGQDNAPLPLRCRACTTILEIKKAIQNLKGVPLHQQALSYDGKRLKHKDDTTLKELGIEDIAEVDLSVEIVPSGFKRPESE